MRPFCKNSLTARSRAHISARPTAVALWRPARRRDFGTISRSAPPCWEAGAGRFRSSQVCGLAAEFGFARRFARGVLLQRSQRGSTGEGESFSRRYLTITSEGRETWAAGSLRGFVGWVGLARAGLVWLMGSEETTDGHVSKFIALLRQRAGTSGDGLVLWFAGADVFGTRQE